MTAHSVFHQQDGAVTSAYYARLNQLGPTAQLAVALFRAQKRSSRAKDYRRGKYRRLAYDVKQWSMSEVCRLLKEHGAALGIRWGWREDTAVQFGNDSSYVLYVELPEGQVSFHSPQRGEGPDYHADWDGVRGASSERILRFCSQFDEALKEATAV